MSAALVRQALELVDPEENDNKRGKTRGGRSQLLGAQGQDHRHPYKRKSKKASQESKCKQDLVEENIKKLLALSQPAVATSAAEKIVERAVKRKPLLEKAPEKAEEYKSILFPDEESFKSFEREYFCS